MKPKQALEVIEHIFFSKECNLGDKYGMIQVLSQSVKELSSDPKKY